MSYVKQQDPKVQEMIELELGRQRNKLEMIAIGKLCVSSCDGSTR